MSKLKKSKKHQGKLKKRLYKICLTTEKSIRVTLRGLTKTLHINMLPATETGIHHRGIHSSMTATAGHCIIIITVALDQPNGLWSFFEQKKKTWFHDSVCVCVCWKWYGLLLCYCIASLVFSCMEIGGVRCGNDTGDTNINMASSVFGRLPQLFVALLE